MEERITEDSKKDQLNEEKGGKIETNHINRENIGNA